MAFYHKNQERKTVSNYSEVAEKDKFLKKKKDKTKQEIYETKTKYLKKINRTDKPDC